MPLAPPVLSAEGSFRTGMASGDASPITGCLGVLMGLGTTSASDPLAPTLQTVGIKGKEANRSLALVISKGQSHFRRAKIGTVPNCRCLAGFASPPGEAQQAHQSSAE